MDLNYGKAILIFIPGYLVSWLSGALWNSGEMAVVTAICYIGALIVSSERTPSES